MIYALHVERYLFDVQLHDFFVCVCVCVCVLEGRRRSQVVSEPTTPTGSSNSKKENYIIIVDERKIKVSIIILYRVHQCHSCVYNTCTLLYVMREFTCKVSTNYP